MPVWLNRLFDSSSRAPPCRRRNKTTGHGNYLWRGRIDTQWILSFFASGKLQNLVKVMVQDRIHTYLTFAQCLFSRRELHAMFLGAPSEQSAAAAASPRDLGREGEWKRGNRRSVVVRSIGLALVCACRMTVVVVRGGGGSSSFSGLFLPSLLSFHAFAG